MPASACRAWTSADIEDIRGVVGEHIGPPADREAAERDFGQLVRGTALAVLAPRSIAEVERILAFANARDLRLTARGRGMSQGGQSIPEAGVSLDFSQLVDLDAPDVSSRTMRCSAGTTWRNAIAAAAPHGLLPNVVPLNLDLSVGGLLSVAGVGATSHAFGAAVSNVEELEVVTGGGVRLTCSATREAAVYNAALGGLGRAGLIVAARIQLRPFKPNVRTFYLLYDAVGPWLDAHRTLIRTKRADYLEGFCTPCIQGLRQGPRGRAPFAQWFYGLHVTVEHEPGDTPGEAHVLEGLGPFRLVHVEAGDTVAFAARYDPRFSAMRRSGAWLQPHPWIEAFLPGDCVGEILTAVVDGYPVALGDGPRLLFVNRRGAPPFLRMPGTPEVACCALLPVAVPAHILPDTLDAFRAIHAGIVRGGGKRVLSGWITMMDETALREHYGEQLADWEAAKRTLDPRGILDSRMTYPALT